MPDRLPRVCLAESPLIYKKAKGNKVVTFVTASLSVLFGILMFVAVPIVPYNYIFLSIGCLLPILSIVDNHQLSIGDGKVKYSALHMRWEVELSEIAEWKILGGTGGLSGHALVIHTSSGKSRCVPSLTSLGIRNPNEFAGDFAKCIRAAKKQQSV